jgi:hypothetical protein
MSSDKMDIEVYQVNKANLKRSQLQYMFDKKYLNVFAKINAVPKNQKIKS